MLAQATRSTAPIAPMSTHNMLATPPTTSSFNDRMTGVNREAREGFARQPDIGSERPRVGPDREHALGVGMGLGRRDAGPQAREPLIVQAAVDLQRRRVEPHGDDQVGLRRAIEESEVGRHDAHDFRRPRIDRELTPDGRFVAAESPLPERMRENDRRRPFGRGSVLCFREPTSAHRLHAERLECAVRDSQSAHPLRLTAVGQRRRPSCHRPMLANVRFSSR